MSRSQNYQRYNRLADIIQLEKLNWQTAGSARQILNRLTALEDEIYANTRASRRDDANIVAQYYNDPDFNQTHSSAREENATNGE